MLILGIETSCDETAAAIVKGGTKILSNVVASSQKIHQKTGGIIPEIAAREQIKCLIPVIKETLSRTHLDYQYIDVIAVTTGPGLIGSLLVGVETAKTLAYLWHKPLIPVNHLLAHVYANWLTSKSVQQLNSNTVVGKTVNDTGLADYRFTDVRLHRSTETPKFPAIALIVSGGHTELILMKDHGKYEWLGGTRDDAAGECFDKIARLLGLGYPGGPVIAAAASVILGKPSLTADSKIDSGHIRQAPFNFVQGRQCKQARMTIRLPRPMINSDDFDFSFSGLKTAVLREVDKYKNYNNYNDYKIYMAHEAQEAITDVLVEKAVRAAKKYNVKNILLAGGVAANSRLRGKFQEKCSVLSIKYSVPPPSLCTDNAAAIASCAFFNYKPVPWQKIKTNPSLALYRR